MAKGKWVKCGICKGAGKIKMNGVGRVALGYLTIGLSEAVGTASTCSKCNGKGSIFKQDKDKYK